MSLFIAALATPASAADCGDASGAGGANVDCSCGDTVTGNGIAIHDDLGNGAPNPVELDSNIVKSNGMNGILIAVGATGHELKKNSSGGSGDQANGRCAFAVAAGNFNATGNSANGKGISGADGTPFPSVPIPAGCVP